MKKSQLFVALGLAFAILCGMTLTGCYKKVIRDDSVKSRLDRSTGGATSNEPR